MPTLAKLLETTQETSTVSKDVFMQHYTITLPLIVPKTLNRKSSPCPRVNVDLISSESTQRLTMFVIEADLTQESQ